MAFATLNAASRTEIEAMLNALPEENQRRLLNSMQAIQRLLGATPEHRARDLLRPHQPADMGWVVQRHAGSVSRKATGWFMKSHTTASATTLVGQTWKLAL